MINAFKHWRLEQSPNAIAWAWLDRQGESTNTLNNAVLEELSQLLDEVATSSAVGLVIGSAKPNGFIAGADITQFESMKDAESGLHFLRRGQSVFEKLAQLPVPTVAMISGYCLGGGLELALACQYRVVLDDPATRLGLPEVMLGIHPGWGGTVRLPALVGAVSAMTMILSGRSVTARQAAKMGLANTVVPERQLRHAAEFYVLTAPSVKKPWLSLLSNHSLVRPLIAWFMRRKLAKKVNEAHYPAPFAALRHWVANGVSTSAYQQEATSVASLFVTPTARHLLRVFFLQTRLKSLPADSSFKLRHVHVVGAGVMGGDIAAWCALKGFYVTLQDTNTAGIAATIKRSHALFQRKLNQQHLVQAATDRLQPDVDGDGVIDADVVIEAIYEDLDAKQALMKHLEAKAKPEALLATNTSSIPLEEMSQVMADPSRLVGIHFFNPVAMMQLVEVVHSPVTTAKLSHKATQFVKRLGKLPLPVKSTPGFLVNRVLMPYLMESVLLLSQGHSKECIDHVAKDFGLPMGPIELADTVGLDVCLSVAKNLMANTDADIPACLVEHVDAGKLGKKSGEGFYCYKKGKIQRSTAPPPLDAALQQRLVDKLVQESMECLREGVVTDADLLDAGMIFGAGFAPFRGGPLHYHKTHGL